MKAYFAINPTLYSADNDKIMMTLNKMSEGRGASFAEMWYDKMADSSIKASDKIFDKFTENFETTFYPFDTKATAHLDLSKLIQKTIRCPNGITDNRFQQYITDFQNLTSKAGITDNIILIDQFSLGVDQRIAMMILSMFITPSPSTNGLKKLRHSMCRRCVSKPFEEDILNPPLLFLAPREIPMPWTLTISTYQNSPPQNMPNVSEKAIAFIVAKLATMLLPVAPLAPVTPHLLLHILKTFATLKLPCHSRKSPLLLNPSSTNMSISSKPPGKAMKKSFPP